MLVLVGVRPVCSTQSPLDRVATRTSTPCPTSAPCPYRTPCGRQHSSGVQINLSKCIIGLGSASTSHWPINRQCANKLCAYGVLPMLLSKVHHCARLRWPYPSPNTVRTLAPCNSRISITYHIYEYDISLSLMNFNKRDR